MIIEICEEKQDEIMIKVLKRTYSDTYRFDRAFPDEKELHRAIRKGIRILFQYYLTECDYRDWMEEVKTLKTYNKVIRNK